MKLPFLPLLHLSVVGLTWLRLLPAAIALKGDSRCSLYMCVNATVHGDMVTYELIGLEKPLGWLALGFGPRMKDMHMVIMWPNDDGTTTLSQRMGIGYREPLPVEHSPRIATIANPKVASWHPSTSTGTLAFSIPLNKTQMALKNPTERMIWAYSQVRPGKPHYSQLLYHFSAGFFTLDLSADLSDDGTATYQHHHHEDVPERPVINETMGASSDTQSPFQRHERMMITHGVIASFGFLVLLPAGSLTARWGRTLSSKWFKIHQTLNMWLALPVVTVGWLLGPITVLDRQAVHLFDAHQITGVLLLALYYIQVLLGRYIHRRRANALPNAPTHPPSNILHIILGLIVITLAFIQTRSGMEEWKLATGRAHIAHWCHVLWNTWVVIIPLAYLAGTVLLPRQFHQERNGLNSTSGTYLALSPTRSVVFAVSDEDEDEDEILEKHHVMESLGVAPETQDLESNTSLLNSLHS